MPIRRTASSQVANMCSGPAARGSTAPIRRRALLFVHVSRGLRPRARKTQGALVLLLRRRSQPGLRRAGIPHPARGGCRFRRARRNPLRAHVRRPRWEGKSGGKSEGTDPSCVTRSSGDRPFVERWRSVGIDPSENPNRGDRPLDSCVACVTLRKASWNVGTGPSKGTSAGAISHEIFLRQF